MKNKNTRLDFHKQRTVTWKNCNEYVSNLH